MPRMIKDLLPWLLAWFSALAGMTPLLIHICHDYGLLVSVRAFDVLFDTHPISLPYVIADVGLVTANFMLIHWLIRRYFSPTSESR